MAGAKVTMMASELLQNGINRISEVLDEMKAGWTSTNTARSHR